MVHPPLIGEGVVERLLALHGALRLSGVPVSPAVSIGAGRILLHVDIADRPQLREGLAAATVSSPSERRIFDELFDAYFPPVIGDDPAPPEAGTQRDAARDADPDERDLEDDLVEALLNDDDAVIARIARDVVRVFARVDGRDGAPAWYRYRAARAVDTARVLERALADIDTDDPLAAWTQASRIRRGMQRYEQHIDAEVRRRTGEQRGPEHLARRRIRTHPADRDLFELRAEDDREVRALTRMLARRLATRLDTRRRRARIGRLDVRATIRRSIATGGVPFALARRARLRRRPDLFVLCDVSGSVATFARFTLQFVHALQEQFGKVRSFAFIDALDEVTELFDGVEPPEALARLARSAEVVQGDGHSHYGRAFEDFHERFVDELTPRTSVLILGDARNNHRHPATWVLDDVRHRARRIIWLNPEPSRSWDTGDSLASAYARHVDAFVEVRTLRQLAGFIERLATDVHLDVSSG